MFNKLREILTGKKEEPLPPLLANFSSMAVDIHSHLIPGIDDGAKNMDDSLAMLREFEVAGFKKVITSPHVVSDGFNNSSETILAGRDKVRTAIRENNIALEFDSIAEYFCDETMYPKIEKKDLLTFGNNYVLIEFSYLQKQNVIYEVIYKLQIAGYRVVLAHPERYNYYHEPDFKTYNSLKDRSVYFQINLMSLIGKYGPGAKIAAEKMIDEHLVDFIGTDLHNLNQFANIKLCLNERYLEKILSYDKLLNKTLL